MFWFAQTIEQPSRVLILRGYVDPNGAEKRTQFQGQMVVVLSGDNVATPFGLLNASGQPLTRDDRAQIEQIIRDSGALTVVAQRHGQWVKRTR